MKTQHETNLKTRVKTTPYMYIFYGISVLHGGTKNW